jgi:uncharacterized protein
MQFLVVGLDGTGPEAQNRRQAVRAGHIALGDKLLASGNMWYGAALLNDDGSMKGSMLMMDFPSEKELNEWPNIEPYKTEKVWEQVYIHKCKTRDPWFNRPREFFESRQ